VLTEDQLQKRKAIRIALSDLYLDTELTNGQLLHIARIFKESGFTLETIKEINYREVGPLLLNNVRSVAGEWAGFNANELHDMLEKALILRNPRKESLVEKISGFFRKRSIDRYTGKYFEQIESLLAST
jgi:hypothetical protein